MSDLDEVMAALREKRDAARQVADAAPALLAALKDLLSLIEEGYLARDTSHDSEPGWAMKQLPYVRRLAAASAAIQLAEGK